MKDTPSKLLNLTVYRILLTLPFQSGSVNGRLARL